MKFPEQLAKEKRLLALWKVTRNVAGSLVIVATILMIVSAVIALKNEVSTSQAMKIPLIAAFLLSALFILGNKRIRETEAALKQ